MSNAIKGPPGVGIRECSPSILQTESEWSLGIITDLQGVEVLFSHKSGEPESDWRSIEDVALNLSDPTGFMHGVWALAERFGECDQPRLHVTEHASADGATFILVGLESFRGSSWRHWSSAAEETMHTEHVPALAEIDPEDPQRDAKVLAALMRHVFGEPE